MEEDAGTCIPANFLWPANSWEFAWRHAGTDDPQNLPAHSTSGAARVLEAAAPSARRWEICEACLSVCEACISANHLWVRKVLEKEAQANAAHEQLMEARQKEAKLTAALQSSRGELSQWRVHAATEKGSPQSACTQTGNVDESGEFVRMEGEQAEWSDNELEIMLAESKAREKLLEEKVKRMETEAATKLGDITRILSAESFEAGRRIAFVLAELA